MKRTAHGLGSRRLGQRNVVERSVRWALAKARPASAVDRSWPPGSLLAVILTSCGDFARGLALLGAVPGSRLRFCERGVSVRGKRWCRFGRWLLVERGVTIRARGGEGVELGDFVVLGSHSVLEVSSGLAANRGSIRMGTRSSIGDFCYIGGAGGVEIGDNVLIGQFVSFHSEDHRFDDVGRPIRVQGVTHQGIRVQDDCWIGAGTKILDGVEIGAGSVIAAGAVVTTSVPPKSIVAGVPGRIIRTRGASASEDTNAVQRRPGTIDGREARGVAEPRRRARSLLIAGAQKSCSTSLAELIGRHPSVFMAPREVATFEDPDYPEGLDLLLSEIEALAARGIVPGLKRPELLYHDQSAARAHRHLPEPLVVVVLREPVARTVSAYHHYVRHGLLPAVHPDVGIRAILDDSRYTERSSVRSQIVRYSLYSEPVRRLRHEFGDQLLVLFQDELLSDTADCTARILHLLDLEPADLGTLRRVNAGNYSLRHVTMSRLGGRIGYEVDEKHGTFNVTKRPLRRLVGQAFFAVDRLAPARVGRPPELSPAVRARLVDVLADDAQRLPSLVGRALPEAWMSSLGL